MFDPESQKINIQFDEPDERKIITYPIDGYNQVNAIVTRKSTQKYKYKHTYVRVCSMYRKLAIFCDRIVP